MDFEDFQRLAAPLLALGATGLVGLVAYLLLRGLDPEDWE